MTAVFITLWSGRIVEIPLLLDERCGDLFPEDYRIDVEITRRWLDHLLATQLRKEGVELVDESLIVAGTVVKRGES